MIAMKRLITILLASVAFTTLSAQKYDYSMERIGWINPWTTSSNSSGMVLNETFLQQISSYTEGLRIQPSGYLVTPAGQEQLEPELKNLTYHPS